MANHWGQADTDAARLEAALNRLARLRPPRPPESYPTPAAAELAGRIDTLIAELREALGKNTAD